MPTNKLKQLLKGFGRHPFLDHADPLGPLVAELQDHVEDAETHITTLQGAKTKLVPISFESGEVGTVKTYFPQAVTINTIRCFITSPLSATDAGTITAKNSAGTSMAGGALTIPLSSAFGYQPTAVTPTTNNVVAAGDFIELVTAKTTPGGGGFCEIEYTITP